MKKIFLGLAIILGTALIVFLAGMALKSKPDQAMSAPSAGRGGPIFWVAQDKQNTAQSPEGKFSVKAYLITGQGVLFFYSLQAAQKGTPQFVALSSSVSDTGEQSNEALKVNRVQSLGKLADFEIGVVQVDWIDRAKQVITLQVTPLGSDKYVWQVAPLKQNSPNPKRTQLTWYSADAEPSELQITSGSTIDNSYALLKVFMLDQSEQIDINIPTLYFNVDRQNIVSPLTAAEYTNLNAAAIKPTTPGPDDLKAGQPPRATVAPIEPPRSKP